MKITNFQLKKKRNAHYDCSSHAHNIVCVTFRFEGTLA